MSEEGFRESSHPNTPWAFAAELQDLRARVRKELPGIRRDYRRAYRLVLPLLLLSFAVAAFAVVLVAWSVTTVEHAEASAHRAKVQSAAQLERLALSVLRQWERLGQELTTNLLSQNHGFFWNLAGIQADAADLQEKLGCEEKNETRNGPSPACGPLSTLISFCTMLNDLSDLARSPDDKEGGRRIEDKVTQLYKSWQSIQVPRETWLGQFGAYQDLFEAHKDNVLAMLRLVQFKSVQQESRLLEQADVHLTEAEGHVRSFIARRVPSNRPASPPPGVVPLAPREHPHVEPPAVFPRLYVNLAEVAYQRSRLAGRQADNQEPLKDISAAIDHLTGTLVSTRQSARSASIVLNNLAYFHLQKARHLRETHAQGTDWRVSLGHAGDYLNAALTHVPVDAVVYTTAVEIRAYTIEVMDPAEFGETYPTDAPRTAEIERLIDLRRRARHLGYRDHDCLLGDSFEGYVRSELRGLARLTVAYDKAATYDVRSDPGGEMGAIVSRIRAIACAREDGTP